MHEKKQRHWQCDNTHLFRSDNYVVCLVCISWLKTHTCLKCVENQDMSGFTVSIIIYFCSTENVTRFRVYLLCYNYTLKLWETLYTLSFTQNNLSFKNYLQNKI